MAKISNFLWKGASGGLVIVTIGLAGLFVSKTTSWILNYDNWKANRVENEKIAKEIVGRSKPEDNIDFVLNDEDDDHVKK